MNTFTMSIGLQKKAMLRHFDEIQVERWLKEAKIVQKGLAAQLPDIGGRKNKMRSFMNTSAIIMPIVIVLKREGIENRTIGEVIFDLATITYQMIPSFARNISASRFFSSRKILEWEKVAERSQRKEFPGDWVLTFIQTSPQFHHGYDITECAIVKYWRAQGLEDLVPYLCLTDWAKWSAFGIDAKRTMTLANGDEKCDFRFIGKGGAKHSGWPPESMPEWTGKHKSKPDREDA